MHVAKDLLQLGKQNRVVALKLEDEEEFICVTSL